jgi:hypothetical protein
MEYRNEYKWLTRLQLARGMEYRNEYKWLTRLQLARQIEDRAKEDKDCMILFGK